MSQVSTALGLSLFLHVLLLGMISGWVKKKSEIRILPQFITVLLSYDQNEMIVPMQVRKPADIQKISMPKKNEKQKQIKPDPNREIQESIQTRITNDLSKKTQSPVRLTESRKTDPERKIQTKVEPVSVRPVKNRSLTEQIKPGKHEKSPDIYRTPDEGDNRQSALHEGEENLSSPHNQGLQIARPYYKKNPTPPYPDIARRRGD